MPDNLDPTEEKIETIRSALAVAGWELMHTALDGTWITLIIRSKRPGPLMEARPLRDQLD